MFGKIKAVFRSGRSIRLFLLSLFVSGMSFGIQKGILDNYLAESVGIREFDRGVVEFFRELPGLMLIFIIAALFMLSAEKLYKIGAVVMLIGVGMLSVVPPERILVTLAICIFSLGDHIQLGMKSTLALEYSNSTILIFG